MSYWQSDYRDAQFCVLYGKNNIIRISIIISTSGRQNAMIRHSSFNSTPQLISGISSDLQKLLRYFNCMANVVFLKIPFPLSANVFPNNLALLYIDITKSKSSAASIVVPSTFVILLINGVQFLKAADLHYVL